MVLSISVGKHVRLGVGLIAVAIALVSGAACGKPFPWEGTWQGSRNLGTDPGPSGIGVTASRVKVIIRPDGTFDAEDGGIPIAGMTSQSGDDLTLKPLNVLGVSADKAGPPLNSPIKLHANPDGTVTLSRDGMPERIVLKSSGAQPSP